MTYSIVKQYPLFLHRWISKIWHFVDQKYFLNSCCNEIYIIMFNQLKCRPWNSLQYAFYFKIMIRYLFTLIHKDDLKSLNVFRRGYYDDQSVRELMAKRKDFVKRRLCILPTMSCNLRPNYCCPNTTCRCNLWGQNCRYIYTAQIPFTISQWIHCNLQMPHLIVR